MSVASRLRNLHWLCACLPPTLPEPQVSSYVISLDPEDVEDMGQVGALNRALENTIGMRAHGLVIRERGIGVQHLVDVLREGLEKCKDGRDAILEKWVEDLEKVVMETCQTANTLKSIPVDYRYPAVKGTPIVMEIVSDDDSASPSVPKKPKGSTKPKPQATATRTSPRKAPSKTLEPLFHKSPKAKPSTSTPSLSKGVGTTGDSDRANPTKQEEYRTQARFHDPKYIDIDEPDIDRSKGGAKPDQAVLDATVICKLADRSSDKWKVRCLGSAKCRKVFAYPRKKLRWLDHIASCPHLPEPLRKAVKADFAAGAPAARVEAMEKKRKAEEDSENEGNDARKRAKGGNDHVPKDGNDGGQGMVLDLARKSRRTELKAVLDSDVVQFVCASLIPPSVVDLPQWKKMWSDAVPIYTPASSTTLRDSHIPQQAEFVRQKQMEFIKTQYNLTLTLDGGTTRYPQSVYTIHVTTPSRRTFLVRGDESTLESHTGEYVYRIAKEVVEDIGPHRIAAMYTDDTGNTRKGRRLTCADYPHIINGKDPVHHMHNGCKDIARLPVFETVIIIIRRTIKFFSKSSGAKGHLREAMYTLGISRGLEAIGKTRFATVYYAAASLLRCLPAIAKILDDGTVELPEESDMDCFHSDGHAAAWFKAELTQIVKVLEPLAKSIKCLESGHSTPADVFIFWVATLAEYEEFLSGTSHRLNSPTVQDIRAILNKRYQEMIDSSPSDIYIASFFLVPEYRDVVALDNPNPNKRTFTIRRNGEVDLPIKKSTYERIGKYLVETMLPNEFKLEKENRSPILSEMDTPTATKCLNNQLLSYVLREYPFADGLKKGETPLKYWRRKERHSQAGILACLAVKLFSICPNSMADERTMSKITRLNSALRNRQDATTIIDMIQIASYGQNSPEASAPPPRPVVRFRDLAPELRSQARPVTKPVPKPPNETQDKAKEVEELPKGVEAIEDADAEEVTDDVEERKGIDGEKVLKLVPADAWLDEPREDLPSHLDRKKFVAKDLVNLKSHKLLDLLSTVPREAPAEEDDDDDEARAILGRPENGGEEFVFSIPKRR